jgi:alpha-1,2-mannosyltransferase
MPAADGARSIRWSNSHYRERIKALLAGRMPALALFSFVLVVCLLSGLEVIFHGNDTDFLSFYAAARAATADIDFYDQARLEGLVARHGWGERVYPYLYPPFLAHALRPLAMLELVPAQRIWLAANVVAFAASVSVLLLSAQHAWRAVTPRRRPSSWLLLTLAAVLVWALPLRSNLLFGQVNPLVLVCLSLAVRAQLLGRSALAGIWLAPAIMIKLTPAVLLLFFLLRRDHRALLACTAGLVVMAAASLGLGAADDWLSFLRHAPARTYGADIPGLFPAATVWNFAPAGWLARLLPEHAAWVARLSFMIVAAACLITTRLATGARSAANDGLALAALFPVLLLASPLTYLHHVVYVMPALVIWLLRAWSEDRRALFGATLLAAFIAGTDWASLYDRLLGASASPLLTSINLYAVLALLGIGWKLLRQGMPSGAPDQRVRALASSSVHLANDR